MCKLCQSCLESIYWNCCEERFCYDESIAKYSDEDWENTKCYTNNIGSIDNLAPITRQPNNNNNHIHLDSNRLVLTELPILAPDIYRVFSKSMIFKDDFEVKKYIENEESKYDYSKPTNKNNSSIKRSVSFKNDDDDVNKEDLGEDVKLSDIEIMFQDELYADHRIFKIEEEEEEENDSSKSPVTSPIKELSSATDTQNLNGVESLQELIDKKNEKSDVPHRQISRGDSSRSITRVNSAKNLQKTKTMISRTDSSNSMIRSNSRTNLRVRRVDSMNNLENRNLKSVLEKLPPRSASFLSLSNLLNDAEDKYKAGDVYIISDDFNSFRNGEHSQISKMPDTPVIRSSKFPKFFEETPILGEYKAETSLQSIIQTPDVIFTESDYSMPRYYGKMKAITALSAEDSGQSSRSLPDLNEASSDTMSKRLSKLGSKLKPLIIKKPDESFRNSTQNL